MSHQIVFNDGAQKWCDIVSLYFTTTPSYLLKLYVNSFTLDSGSTVIGDFVEASFGGYTARALSGWGTPTLAYPYYYSKPSPQLWVADGTGSLPQTVYGMYVIDNSDGKLLWGETFPVAQLIAAANDYVLYRPRLNWSSLYRLAYPSGPLDFIRVQNLGKKHFIRAVTGLGLPTGYRCHLFQNSPAMTDQLSIGAFTESTYPGYASQAISGFNASSLVSSQWVAISTSVLFFLCTGSGSPQNANGYYVTENSTGELVWSEYFAIPAPMNDNTGFATVLPQISTQSEFTL